MRESALSFVIDEPGLASVPYCRDNHRTRGLVPHVTVLYPWCGAPLEPSAIERASAVVAGTGPLTMHFDRLETFPSGVVYAALADPVPTLALMARVWAAFPGIPPYGGQVDEPVPHLTLGWGEPADLADTLDKVQFHTDGLLPFEVQLTDLGVLEQGSDGRWAVVGQVSLL